MKTDETICKPRLSEGTPPPLPPHYFSNFFMTPLFVQTLKTRTPLSPTPLILGGGNYEAPS